MLAEACAFAERAAGTTSQARSFTLANQGTAPLAIGTAALAGAGSPQFALGADACSGGTLAVGAACSIEVRFAPTSAGAASATLTVPSDDELSPATVALAGTATAELVAMQKACASRDFVAAFAIWARLGPLARYCWRAPIRDYRPRMKEVLKLQGLFPHATVRAPQLGVDDDERAELRRLAQAAGLLG